MNTILLFFIVNNGSTEILPDMNFGCIIPDQDRLD